MTVNIRGGQSVTTITIHFNENLGFKANLTFIFRHRLSLGRHGFSATSRPINNYNYKLFLELSIDIKSLRIISHSVRTRLPYETTRCQVTRPSLCASQIEASTSPRATPWAFQFLENFCSNYPLPGPKSCSNAPTRTCLRGRSAGLFRNSGW